LPRTAGAWQGQPERVRAPQRRTRWRVGLPQGFFVGGGSAAAGSGGAAVAGCGAVIGVICDPECKKVSLDIITLATPPTPAKLPLGHAATRRQRGPAGSPALGRQWCQAGRQARLLDPDHLSRSRIIASVEIAAFSRASGNRRRLPGQGDRPNESTPRAKPLALLRSPDCPERGADVRPRHGPIFTSPALRGLGPRSGPRRVAQRPG
jgi:hypothetical protein